MHANGHLLPSNAEFRNTYAYVFKFFFLNRDLSANACTLLPKIHHPVSRVV